MERVHAAGLHSSHTTRQKRHQVEQQFASYTGYPATMTALHFINCALLAYFPYYLAYTQTSLKAERMGPLKPHRDGTRSVYGKDSEGNVVEFMDPSSL